MVLLNNISYQRCKTTHGILSIFIPSKIIDGKTNFLKCYHENLKRFLKSVYTGLLTKLGNYLISTSLPMFIQ